MTDITFSMIKPDAYAAGYAGAILAKIEAAGFRVIALRLTRLSKEHACDFYAVHRERPFYKELCAYISSGIILPMVLKKEHAVEDFRRFIGHTDPQKAAKDSIRALYAKSIEANAIHGSDSNENARVEAAFFFSAVERYEGV